MSNLVLTDKAKSLASPNLLAKMESLAETLESVENPTIPKVGFKDGFTINNEKKDSFEGILIYAKNSNAWYSKPYNPNNPAAPDCASSDGKHPTHGDQIQSDDCKKCPRNEFGSSKTGGEGKDCKNMKVLFFLSKGAIIPQSLNIPPTSITNVNSYLLSLAAKGKSFYQVLTKFESYKKEPNQTHYNIRLKCLEDLPDDESKDALIIKQIWEPSFKKEVVSE